MPNGTTKSSQRSLQKCCGRERLWRDKEASSVWTRSGASGIARGESVSPDPRTSPGMTAHTHHHLYFAALVSPKDLRLAAPYLLTYSLTTSDAVRVRVFPSGLTILYAPRFSLPAFASRLFDLLDLRQAIVASLSEAEASGLGEIERREREGVNVLEVAQAEKLSVGLAKEMMDLLEMGEAGGGSATSSDRRGGGHVVRDDQGGEGTRWFRNLISSAIWDGQTFPG